MDRAATGRLLRKLRTGRGLELEDLESATGLSPSHVSRLERGTVPNPRWGDLEKLAAYYGLQVWELAQPDRDELAPLEIDPEIRMGALILQDGLRDMPAEHQKAAKEAYLVFVRSLSGMRRDKAI